jgi:putative transposase
MPNYRRSLQPGGTFFFTVITYQRFPIFNNPDSINLLKECFKSIKTLYPFRIDAIVILPEHLHTIWTLPDTDIDYSTRWKLIKSHFSRRYSGIRLPIESESMFNKHEKGIWQRRFWEHQIRDQDDFNAHCDYIHYNPVKHGMVISPGDWKYSSFKQFVAKGYYPENWGQFIEKSIEKMDYE